MWKYNPFTKNFDYYQFVTGMLEYRGTWDASTAIYPSSPAKGDYYVASVAGTISGVYYAIGDWMVYNGTSWDKVDNTVYLTKALADTYYYPLSTNPAGYYVGTSSTIKGLLSAGTGISYDNSTGIITNSLPDQTVVINPGTNITSVTGTYPNFTINAANQTTSLAGETLDVITGRGNTTSNAITVGNITDSGLTASKVVFTDTSKVLTSTGIGTSAQFVKADGSLDSSTYLTSLSGALLATGATVGATSQAQAFTNGVKTGLIFPSADSTTAVQITKANGSTSIIDVDTTNGNLTINANSGASYPGLTLKNANANGSPVLFDLYLNGVEKAYVQYLRGATDVLKYFCASDIAFLAGSSEKVRITSGGNVSIGIGASPTAYLHIKAGTATAGTAPIKLTSGTNLTTAEIGAMEYDGTHLFFTPTGTLRERNLTGWNAGGTLTAGTTTTVTDATAKTTSTIFLQATSLGITTLQPYISTKNNGNFVITTLTALGTESFDYLIVN